MNKTCTRRDFVRLLVLGGAALYLPACGDRLAQSDKHISDDSSAQTLGDQTDSGAIDQQIEEIIEVWDSDDVVFLRQNNPDYAQYKGRFNKDIDKSPAVIALCYSTAGVVRAINIARQEGLTVAVKSGGHSFEGFSSNDGGLVVDLTFMNAITWDDDQHVRIQPACKLAQLYDELLPQKRLIPAGSCGGVGVGGLTLGGGYGFFSRRYGLTCDSLTGLTMVDGAGRVHEVRDEHELLWACRGGGNGNFGVVTEFKFNTHAAPEHFHSHRFKAYKLTTERARSLLEQWFLFSKNLPESCFSAFVLNGKTLTLLITNYAEPEAGLQSMLDRFDELCDKTTVGKAVPLARALKTYYGRPDPLYFKNASAGLYRSFADIEACIDTVIEKVIHSSGLIYQVNTLGGKIDSAEFERQSCYPHRRQLYLSELQAYWENESHGAALKRRFDEIQDIFIAYGIDKQYRNYPNLKFPDWQQAYYGDNYARLQQIKTTYDPDDVFHHPQSVAPATPDHAASNQKR